MKLSLIAAFVALLVVVQAATNARENRLGEVELSMEFSRYARLAAVAIGGAMYIAGVVVFRRVPPETPQHYLFVLVFLSSLTIGVSFVLNKRVALHGRSVIDVSFMGRRRAVLISSPVRFESTWLGERLYLRAYDLFVPGSWMSGYTEAAGAIREKFKAEIMSRARPAKLGAPPA
jgi:hypothetical protein